MSANNVSMAHQAFNNLLTTLTPAQIQQFVQQIQATNAGPNVTVDPPTTATGAGDTATAMSSRPSNARGKRGGENTKLRPLNSFIAFRSFYSAIFPELTQKVKSGLLRFLWKSDPFKAKWAVLAKAYSIVRDDNPGKGVTLESFLALNSQFIGIVAPADYLNAMGLQLIDDGEGNYSLAGGSPASNLNAAHATTNHSVDDIVSRCYDTGYVTGAAPVNSISHQGAFVAQPNIQVNANNPSTTGTTSNAVASTNIGNNHNQPLNAGGANVTHPSNGVATNATASIPGNTAFAPHPAANNGNIGGPNAGVGAGNAGVSVHTNVAGTAGNSPNLQPSYAPQPLVPTIRNVAPRPNSSAEEYYGLFNPGRDPIYMYNPYRSNSDWDAFDLNDFVNM